MNSMNIILCISGTIGFCSILNMPKDKILYAGIGALLSATIQEYMMHFLFCPVFIATAAAAFAIGIYSEIIARIKKTPATVIRLPSTIPLLPGGSLYYAMSFLLHGEYKKFGEYASETVSTGFGIAVGAIATAVVMQIIHYIKNKNNNLLE